MSAARNGWMGRNAIEPTKGLVMKILGQVLVLMIMLAMAIPAAAQENTWGLGAGVLDGDFGIQVRKDIWLGGDISGVTVQGGMYFHNKTTFRLDADYHFNLKSGNERFYPLVGLDLAFNSDNVKLMINGGGGLNFKLTEKTDAFAEAKYVFGSWDGWALIGGIYF